MIKKLLVTLFLTLCITLIIPYYTKVKAEVGEGVAGISETLDKIEIEYQWTTDRLNLRSEPSTNSEIILTIDKREKVFVISKLGKWTQICYQGNIGYVSNKYLRDTELPSLDFTDDEIDLLAKIMWLEAKNQSDEGLAAIYIVVKNRILSLEFSDTMLEVLSDKTGECYEFSTWKLIDTAMPDERIYEIIDEVQCGLWDGLLDENYVYFSTSPRNNHGTIKIDDHYFCQY